MRADRLLAITMLLQARGKMTAHTLAEELGVSRRTILRDVEALSFAGVPIYADGGHGGGIALDENYRTSLTGLNEDEVRALFISGDNSLLRDIGLGEAAESTLRKLSAALPERHQPAMEQVRQRIHIDPVWWWHDSQPLPFWDELQQAVFEDRRVQAVYEHYSGDAVERILEPYSLVNKASLWYVIARRDEEFRIYRASRFHRVSLLDTHFHRLPDFDLAAFWREHLQEFVETLSEYPFTLRIHSSRLNFVRWLTPGRFQIVEPPVDDGWFTASLHLESMDLAKMLVFGLGTQVIVLNPPELQQAVLDTARELLETGLRSG
jgi:predicted DNA-binding transcriptional regulator YafY